MTERKTLNKYYPIDFDPSKIPKLKAKQKEQNRLWGIRVMAPFNMKCNTCGEYVYKGKKFNSKKETVEDEDYLGIQIHRFYIRCPKCVAVIAFKTDPENCDYTLEAGATRNFEAAKTLMDMEKKKQKEIEDEEAANPMKVLENRTKQSRNEMDMMEALTELRELNARHEKVDHEGMIKKMELYQKELARLQKEEEDRLVRELYGATEAESSDKDLVRRIEDDSDSDGDSKPLAAKRSKMTPSKPTDFLTDEKLIPSAKSNSLKKPTNTKALLSSLVRVKKSSTSNTVSTAQKSGESGSSLTAPQPQGDTTKSTQGAEKTTPNNALGMLGSYSSSETDSD